MDRLRPGAISRHIRSVVRSNSGRYIMQDMRHCARPGTPAQTIRRLRARGGSGGCRSLARAGRCRNAGTNQPAPTGSALGVDVSVYGRICACRSAGTIHPAPTGLRRTAAGGVLQGWVACIPNAGTNQPAPTDLRSAGAGGFRYAVGGGGTPEELHVQARIPSRLKTAVEVPRFRMLASTSRQARDLRLALPGAPPDFPILTAMGAYPAFRRLRARGRPTRDYSPIRCDARAEPHAGRHAPGNA